MSTVPIGPAAALYDVAPSTLRWWEREGVLGTSRGADGRRRYGDDELRLIGFVYLCHVVGLMPLEQTAIVVGDSVGRDRWRATVADAINALSERIDDLTAAREYLRHLRTCSSDPPLVCSHLEDQLREHTPVGRFPKSSNLTDAARQACRA